MPFQIILPNNQVHLYQNFFPEEEILGPPPDLLTPKYLNQLYYLPLKSKSSNTPGHVSDCWFCYASKSSYPSPLCHLDNDRTKNTKTLFLKKKVQWSNLSTFSRNSNYIRVQRYWCYESYWKKNYCQIDLLMSGKIIDI